MISSASCIPKLHGAVSGGGGWCWSTRGKQINPEGIDFIRISSHPSTSVNRCLARGPMVLVLF